MTPTALVTGATSGIGLATAAGLVARGVDVVVTGRDEQRGRDAMTLLNRRAGAHRSQFLRADHATIAGNLELATTLRSRLDRLDVLVNNVGAMHPRRHVTDEGHEALLATNLLGPVALTRELMPLLTAAGGARCVNVVSAAFGLFKGDPLADPEAARRYVAIEQYGRTKLLNLLWSLHLADTVPPESVTVNAVHPGTAWTDLTSGLTPDAVPSRRYVWPLVRAVQRRRKPERAAATSIHLACSPELAGVTGRYFHAKPRPAGLSPQVRDPETRARVAAFAADLIASTSIR